jgi:hypothetical protein
MQIYARIENQSQIDALRNIKPLAGVEYKYSLFFEKTKHGMMHLLSKGQGILFIQNGLVDTGNFRNVEGSDQWAEYSYAGFLDILTASL